jgi:hypothetical protein
MSNNRRLSDSDIQRARSRKNRRVQKIRLVQVVAPYIVDQDDENAVVPVFTDLYYNFDDPDLPLPWSAIQAGKRNLEAELVAIDYNGKVFNADSEFCQSLIADYQAKTQYLLNAVVEAEKPPVVTNIIERRVPAWMILLCMIEAITVLALVAELVL